MTRPADRLLNTSKAGAVKTGLKTGGAPGGTSTLRARRVASGSGFTVSAATAFEIVIHGSDNTAARPAAKIVMWVGSATPDNGLDYDLHYPADI